VGATGLNDWHGTTLRTPRTPNGAWPQEMRAETAAAYCDEPSVESFLRKVARGTYPQPTHERGCLPKWSRVRLDQIIARRHGLQFGSSALPEDVSELI
jgi:hypothetical protein